MQQTTAQRHCCNILLLYRCEINQFKDHRVTDGVPHILIGGDTRHSSGHAPGALTANIKRTRSLPGRMERRRRPFN